MSKSDRNLIENSHNSLEIDWVESSGEHIAESYRLDTSKNKQDSAISSSFVNASIDIGNQQPISENYLIGLSLMILRVFIKFFY